MTTIFMPLTVLYGMNYKVYAGTLDWRWAYPLVLLAMGAVAFMALWFKNKWLESCRSAAVVLPIPTPPSDTPFAYQADVILTAESQQ